MSTIIQVDTTLITVNCGECGGVYGLNERYHEQARKTGRAWTCPYCGCSWGYVEGENAKLKRQLEAANNKLTRELANHDQTKASLRAQKAATTRFKNRIAAGTCPCCDRSFEDLASHMAADHPDFATTAQP